MSFIKCMTAGKFRMVLPALSFVLAGMFFPASDVAAQASDVLPGQASGIVAAQASDAASSGIPVLKMRPAAVSESLPASVDNSRLKYFPPVIDQIGGSCAQASNIGYLFTYEMNRLLDRDASVPENRFSYLYTWNMINGGIDEGSLGIDGLGIALSNGVVTEADFPSQYYAGQFYWTSGFEKYLRGIHYRVKNFVTIEVRNMDGINQVRQYLYNKNEEGKPGGIVTFSSRAGEWKFDNNYSGPSETGYDCLLTRLSPTGAHAMTITGYDDLVEFTAPDGIVYKGAFIVTNTYGTAFHDNGRYYLPYWFFLQERNPSDLGYDVTGADVEYRKPEIVFKVGLEYSSRNDLKFRFGVSNKSSDETPMHDFSVPVFNQAGGEYPMQGNGKSGELEFALDFSNYVKRVDEMEEPNFFLTVSRSDQGSVAGSGKMLSFSVYDFRADYENPTVYTCADVAGKVLEKGDNLFNVPTVEPSSTSYSPLKWLNSFGKPYPVSFVFKTAQGKYAKAKFSDYDREAGTITLKYVYAPGGSRNIK